MRRTPPGLSPREGRGMGPAAGQTLREMTSEFKDTMKEITQKEIEKFLKLSKQMHL